jgi:signal transduction histidine kinase
MASMADDRIARVAPTRPELASGNALELLQQISETIASVRSDTFVLDLSAVTWIGQLPLLYLCLGVQHVAQAHFATRLARMPAAPKVRGFLERWGFYQILHHYRFEIDRIGDPATYGGSLLKTRVLEIHRFSTYEQAQQLRDHLRRTDTDLRKILEASHLSHREIQGLADLVVYELCKNAVEHSLVRGDAFIFGRFSPSNDRSRSVQKAGAAPWEKDLLDAVQGKGFTELVLGDPGVGIIETLGDIAEIKAPEAILDWAFQPLSTRKHEGEGHTRGLWAVRNKVRQLRGVLYVRTSDGKGGSVGAVWDFTNPAKSNKTTYTDKTPFGGTQFQILLPQRPKAEPRTIIQLDRRAIAGSSASLSPRGFSLPDKPPRRDLGLRAEIETLDEDDVLFIDMSAMQKKWGRHNVETIAKDIHDGLVNQFGRIWLLDPSPQVIEDLQASRWIQSLWQQGILVPIATLRDDKPPRVEYVLSDVAVRSLTDTGDTPRARRALLNAIGLAFSDDNLEMPELEDPDEQSWLESKLDTNRALVSIANGRVLPALDVETLAASATESLLVDHITGLIDARFRSQDEEKAKAWYRLPSRRYCRYYIGPHIFDQLTAGMANALDRRIERMIRQSEAEYAIGFTSFAEKELARAARANVPYLITLRHYSEAKALEDLRKRIPAGSRAVILLLISGSGRTIARLAGALMDRGVDTTIVCAVDTTTDEDRAEMPLLDRLARSGRLKSIVRRQVPSFFKIPKTAEDAALPIVVIDPETLRPLAPVDTAADILTDGEFWTLVANSRAMSGEAITYKGVDYTTMFWPRKLSENEQVAKLIARDLKQHFPDGAKPDILCIPDDTIQAVTPKFLLYLERALPGTRIIKEEDLLKGPSPDDAGLSEGELQGKYVAIFSIASSSGSGVARLLKYFVETAGEIYLSLFINRIPEGITAAFTRQGKVQVATFKRIYSGSPELRIGSSRSVAIRSLDDYRPSCLSSRLLLFVEERRSFHTDNPKVAQSPDELQQITRPIPPPFSLQFGKLTYDFSSELTISNLEVLISACQPGDVRWLYAILDEAASRSEAGLRAIGADRSSWRDRYLDNIERLYKTAPQESTTAKQAILSALLLERWEWHGVRPPDEPLLAAEGLGEALLEDIFRPGGTAFFRAVCIRSLSKVHRHLLLEHLEEVIEVARQDRETELTLSLELSKVLDDPKSATVLIESFSGILRKRKSTPLAPAESELDIAVENILEDIGLHAAGDTVEFLPWKEVSAILEDEPPDHDRTIRSLIRAMRGRFHPEARFLYYREIEEQQYSYGDSFPRRSPTNTGPVPEANVDALRLLKSRDEFYSACLGTDPSATVQDYVRGRDALKSWGMAMFVMRFKENKGIIRVWQDVNRCGPMPEDAVKEMQTAVRGATRLIDRPASLLAETGVWHYQRIVETLQEHRHRDEPTEFDPLRDFTNRVRILLGGDLASVLVRDPATDTWTRRALVERSVPTQAVSFPGTQTSRLTNYVATHLRPRKFRDRAEALDAGFTEMLPARWLQAWVAIPLLQHEKCNAVVHVWHHTPGWFEPFEDDILTTLGNLGAGIAEVARRYYEATKYSKMKFASAGLEAVTATLVNLSLAADTLIQDDANKDERSQRLARCLREIQQNIAQIPTLLEIESTDLVPTDLGALVASAVDDARQRYGRDKFDLDIVDDLDVDVDVDAVLLRRALTELLKNAKAHLLPGGQVHVKVRENRENATISIEVKNPGYGVRDEDKEKIFQNMGAGLVLAKAAVERHGGTIAEVGAPGKDAIFRVTLPVAGRTPAR